MQRGDIVTVATPGDYGNPRPVVVIQGGLLNQANARSTIVALMTSTIVDAPLLRLTINSTEANGLKKSSQIQANRILTLPTEKVGQCIRHIN